MLMMDACPGVRCELEQNFKERLVTNLEAAFHSTNVPPEILQVPLPLESLAASCFHDCAAAATRFHVLVPPNWCFVGVADAA